MTDIATLGIAVDSRKVGQARDELGRFVKSAGDAERATLGLNTATAALAAAMAAATAATSKLISVQREFDRLNAGLITVTGSAEAAAGAFAQLEKLAADTPFSLQQVTQAFTKLANYGLNPGAKAIKSYGNTASALGKDLSQMVEAVADAATGEFERLKEFGIKSAKEGDKVAFTFRGTTTTVKNSAQEIENYLMRLGEVDFAGNMDARMKTLDGAISNLGDSWDRFFRTVSDAGAGGAIESAVRGATSALDELDELMKSGAAAGFAAEVGKLTAEMSAGAAVIREMTGDLDPLKIAFQTVTVLGANVAFVFRQIGSDIGAAAAAAGAAGRGEFKQALDIFRMRGEDAGRARQELDAFVDRVMAGDAALDKQTTAAGTATKALEDYRVKSGQVAQTEEQKKQAIEAYNLRLDTMTSLLREAWDELDAIAKQQQEYGKALWSGNDALEEQARRLEREVEFYGMTESAIQAVMIARLEEARAIAAINGASEDHLDFLQREIDARKRIAEASSQREALDASRKSAEDAARQWDRAAADIERALTDSLMRAFESGKDFGDAFAKSLQATFKTMLLRVAVQAVVSPVQGAIGSALEVPGGGGGGVGSLVGQAGTSMLGSLAGSGLVSLGGALGAGTAAGGFATGLGTALSSGAGFSGTMVAGSALSSTAGGAAAGLGMQVGAVLPYIGAALAVASALGAFSGKGVPKSMAGGGGYFDAARTVLNPAGQAHWTNYTTADAQMGAAVLPQSVLALVRAANPAYSGGAYVKGEISSGRSSNQMLAQAIGPGGTPLYHRFVESGKGAGDYEKFAAEQIPKLQLALLVDAFRSAGSDMRSIADSVVGASGDLTDALSSIDAAATAAELTALSEVFKTLKATLPGMTGQAVAGLAKMSGGAAAFASVAAQYADAVFTDAEKQSAAQRQMAEAFSALGFAVPSGVAGLRSLVESQDLATESGQRAALGLMGLAPTLRAVEEATREATEAARQQAETVAAQVAQERQGLELRLLQAQGRTAELAAQQREIERSAAAEVLRPLLDQIYAAEDAATAAAAAQDALNAAQQQAAQVAQERQGLELRLLQAQGRTAELAARQREIERSSAAEVLRPLLDQIYAAEDAATAAAAAQDALNAAQQQAAQVAQERQGLQARIDELQGNVAAIRERELAALDPSNRALQERIYALQDEAQASSAAAEEVRAAFNAYERAAAATRSQVEENARAQIQALEKQHAAAKAAAEAQVDAAEKTAAAARSLSASLKSAATRFNPARASDRAGALRTLDAALADARSGVSIAPQAGRIEGALDALSTIAAEAYASGEEYYRDQARAASLTLELSRSAAAQESVAEMTLAATRAAAEASEAGRRAAMSAVERQHADSLAALDAQVAEQRRVVNAVLGVDDSVVSMRDALARLGAALGVSPADITPESASVAAPLARQPDAPDPTLTGLREDQRSQMAAVAAVLGRLTRIVERWDGDGIPETRAV